METAHERGLAWDTEKARHAIDYFEQVLHLNGGQYEGQPFYLLDWQLFIVGSLFGWVDTRGNRRFRVAYVETGKGSGKSPLAAGIGLYGLTADRESRAEIYAAATKKDQAMILFRDAVAMVDQTPELSERIVKSGGAGKEWNLAFHAQHSFFRPIASDNSQSGPRPHIALLDEIHEHKTPIMVELMRAGTKSRRQALIFMITNAGTDRTSVCYDYHDYACKVAANQIKDDAFFGYVCKLDDKEDPLQSEECWEKVNPSLAYGIPGYQYIREQVVQARGMPSKEAVVRRLNFCEWVESHNPFIGADVWTHGAEEIDPAQLVGRSCFGGLDLGSTQDLTAMVLLFLPTEDDPVYRLVPHFWLPAEGLSDKSMKDRVPYLSWVKHAHLETTPGRAISKRIVAQRVAEITAPYELKVLAFDRWRIEDFKQVLEDEGIDLSLQNFGQGFQSMSPAVEQFERLLLGGEMMHNNNPCMTWCAANAVVEFDAAGNRKLSKRKAVGRIDGMIAAVMAAGMTLTKVDQPSIYETRGVIAL